MAAALNQRFGALLRTDPDSVDALELKIGEAQQIYPEIWRYLDEAHAALAARGIAVTDYDTIRALEPPGQQAVSRIDVSAFSALGGLPIGDELYNGSKSATFHVEGHRLAAAAVRVLEAALPDVDWAGLDHAERAEIAAAGSLTAGNWLQLGKTLGVLAAALAIVLVIYKVMS